MNIRLLAALRAELQRRRTHCDACGRPLADSPNPPARTDRLRLPVHAECKEQADLDEWEASQW